MKTPQSLTFALLVFLFIGAKASINPNPNSKALEALQKAHDLIVDHAKHLPENFPHMPDSGRRLLQGLDEEAKCDSMCEFLPCSDCECDSTSCAVCLDTQNHHHCTGCNEDYCLLCGGCSCDYCKKDDLNDCETIELSNCDEQASPSDVLSQLNGAPSSEQFLVSITQQAFCGAACASGCDSCSCSSLSECTLVVDSLTSECNILTQTCDLCNECVCQDCTLTNGQFECGDIFVKENCDADPESNICGNTCSQPGTCSSCECSGDTCNVCIAGLPICLECDNSFFCKGCVNCICMSQNLFSGQQLKISYGC